MARNAWLGLVFVSALSFGCEEEDEAVETPWDASGSWAMVQAVDTIDGVTTYTDYPLDLGGDLLSVEYDLSTDGTYEQAAITTEPDGTVSAIVDPDPLTWWSTGERSVRLLVAEGDPHVELDCAAAEGNDDVLYCVVDIESAYGGGEDVHHAVTLERL
jgi:hypothetical protein